MENVITRKLIKIENVKSDKVLMALSVLMFSSFFIFNTSVYSSISVIVLSLLMLLYALVFKKDLYLKFDVFHLFFGLFVFFCFSSSLWALNWNYSVEKGVTLLEIFVCISIFYSCVKKNINYKDLLSVVVYSGYLVSIYIVLYYGFSNIAELFSENSRLGSDIANANVIGMLCSITLVLTLYLSLFVKTRLLYILSLFPLIILVLSQSRTAIIEASLGILLVYIFSFFKIKKGRIIFKGIISLLIIVLIAVIILKYTNYLEGVLKRFEYLFSWFSGNYLEADNSSIVRFRFIELGKEIFIEHPIVGIGMGNARIYVNSLFNRDGYLHNNYVELLANGGLVGFLIYYLPYGYLLLNFLQKLKNKYPYSDLGIIIILIILIADYGKVTYYSKQTYFILAVMFVLLLGISSEKRRKYE